MPGRGSGSRGAAPAAGGPVGGPAGGSCRAVAAAAAAAGGTGFVGGTAAGGGSTAAEHTLQSCNKYNSILKIRLHCTAHALCKALAAQDSTPKLGRIQDASLPEQPLCLGLLPANQNNCSRNISCQAQITVPGPEVICQLSTLVQFVWLCGLVSC